MAVAHNEMHGERTVEPISSEEFDDMIERHARIVNPHLFKGKPGG